MAGSARRRCEAASTPRPDRWDISDRRDRDDSTEPADSQDPTEQIDSAEPTLAIEANEPTLPIDSIDPLEQIDSMLSCDHNDQREPELFIAPAFQPVRPGVETRRCSHQARLRTGSGSRGTGS